MWWKDFAPIMDSHGRAARSELRAGKGVVEILSQLKQTVLPPHPLEGRACPHKLARLGQAESGIGMSQVNQSGFIGK